MATPPRPDDIERAIDEFLRALPDAARVAVCDHDSGQRLTLGTDAVGAVCPRALATVLRAPPPAHQRDARWEYAYVDVDFERAEVRAFASRTPAAAEEEVAHAPEWPHARDDDDGTWLRLGRARFADTAQLGAFLRAFFLGT